MLLMMYPRLTVLQVIVVSRYYPSSHEKLLQGNIPKSRSLSGIDNPYGSSWSERQAVICRKAALALSAFGEAATAAESAAFSEFQEPPAVRAFWTEAKVISVSTVCTVG